MNIYNFLLLTAAVATTVKIAESETLSIGSPLGLGVQINLGESNEIKPSNATNQSSEQYGQNQEQTTSTSLENQINNIFNILQTAENNLSLNVLSSIQLSGNSTYVLRIEGIIKILLQLKNAENNTKITISQESILTNILNEILRILLGTENIALDGANNSEKIVQILKILQQRAGHNLSASLSDIINNLVKAGTTSLTNLPSQINPIIGQDPSIELSDTTTLSNNISNIDEIIIPPPFSTGQIGGEDIPVQFPEQTTPSNNNSYNDELQETTLSPDQIKNIAIILRISNQLLSNSTPAVKTELIIKGVLQLILTNNKNQIAPSSLTNILDQILQILSGTGNIVLDGADKSEKLVQILKILVKCAGNNLSANLKDLISKIEQNGAASLTSLPSEVTSHIIPPPFSTGQPQVGGEDIPVQYSEQTTPSNNNSNNDESLPSQVTAHITSPPFSAGHPQVCDDDIPVQYSEQTTPSNNNSNSDESLPSQVTFHIIPPPFSTGQPQVGGEDIPVQYSEQTTPSNNNSNNDESLPSQVTAHITSPPFSAGHPQVCDDDIPVQYSEQTTPSNNNSNSDESLPSQVTFHIIPPPFSTGHPQVGGEDIPVQYSEQTTPSNNKSNNYELQETTLSPDQIKNIAIILRISNQLLSNSTPAVKTELIIKGVLQLILTNNKNQIAPSSLTNILDQILQILSGTGNIVLDGAENTEKLVQILKILVKCAGNNLSANLQDIISKIEQNGAASLTNLPSQVVSPLIPLLPANQNTQPSYSTKLNRVLNLLLLSELSTDKSQSSHSDSSASNEENADQVSEKLILKIFKLLLRAIKIQNKKSPNPKISSVLRKCLQIFSDGKQGSLVGTPDWKTVVQIMILIQQNADRGTVIKNIQLPSIDDQNVGFSNIFDTLHKVLKIYEQQLNLLKNGQHVIKDASASITAAGSSVVSTLQNAAGISVSSGLTGGSSTSLKNSKGSSAYTYVSGGGNFKSSEETQSGNTKHHPSGPFSPFGSSKDSSAYTNVSGGGNFKSSEATQSGNTKHHPSGPFSPSGSSKDSSAYTNVSGGGNFKSSEETKSGNTKHHPSGPISPFESSKDSSAYAHVSGGGKFKSSDETKSGNTKHHPSGPFSPFGSSKDSSAYAHVSGGGKFKSRDENKSGNTKHHPSGLFSRFV